MTDRKKMKLTIGRRTKKTKKIPLEEDAFESTDNFEITAVTPLTPSGVTPPFNNRGSVRREEGVWARSTTQSGGELILCVGFGENGPRSHIFRFKNDQLIKHVLDEIYRELALNKRTDMSLYIPPPRDEWCRDDVPIGTYGIQDMTKVLYLEKPAEKQKVIITLDITIHSSAQNLEVSQPQMELSFRFGGALQVDKAALICEIRETIWEKWCMNLSKREHYGLYLPKDDRWLDPNVSADQAGLVSKTKLMYRLLPSAPIHLAFERCDRENLIGFLESCTDFDVLDDQGRNLLHMAAEVETGSVVVRYLLKKNVDVNQKDKNGLTPAMTATLRGSIKTVRLFLQSGKLNTRLTNDEGISLLHLLSYVQESDSGKTNYRSYLDATHLSNRRIPTSNSQTLAPMVAPGGPPTREERKHIFRPHHIKNLAPCEHCTKVILRECQKCSSCKRMVHDRCVASFRSICIPEKNPLVSLLSDLIAQGAKPFVRDQYGYFPLHYACIASNIAVVDFYIRRYGFHPDARSQMGESCLHLSVLSGDKALVQLLLQFGASRYVLTATGHLPIDYARSEMNLLLRDYGTKAAGDVWCAIRDDNLEGFLELITDDQQEKHRKRGRDIINESVIWACVRKKWRILQWLVDNEIVDYTFISPQGYSALHALVSHTSTVVEYQEEKKFSEIHPQSADSITRSLVKKGGAKGFMSFTETSEDSPPQESANPQGKAPESTAAFAKPEMPQGMKLKLHVPDPKILDFIDMFLTRGGRDDLRLQNGDTLVHTAILSENSIVLNALLEFSPPLGRVNVAGESELHYAVATGKVEIVGRLILAGVKHVDWLPLRHGYTPYHLSKFQTDPKITELLEPHHNERTEREYKEKEKEREREKERRMRKEAEKVASYQKSKENEERVAHQHQQTQSQIKKRIRKHKPSSKQAISIGAPTNLCHVVHVDLDFRWSGDNPAAEFEFLDRLGAGAWGTVYKAVHKKSGYVMAIKSLPFDVNSEAAAKLRKEVNVFKGCDHVNVVRYFGCYDYGEDSVWVIMEYCSGGSIYDRLKGINCEKKKFNSTEIASILKSVLDGLGHMHDRGFIHRDIKSGNILLDVNGVPKLADFGLAAHIGGGEEANQMCGTPLFMAPEVVSGEEHDYSADIWSLGITCLELADGKPPWINDHLMRVMYKIVHGTPPKFRDPSQWSDEFNDFLDQCLQKDPRARPSAKDLLSHPFIRTVPEETSFEHMAKKYQLERANAAMLNQENKFLPHNLRPLTESDMFVKDSPILVDLKTVEKEGGEEKEGEEKEGEEKKAEEEKKVEKKGGSLHDPERKSSQKDTRKGGSLNDIEREREGEEKQEGVKESSSGEFSPRFVASASLSPPKAKVLSPNTRILSPRNLSSPVQFQPASPAERNVIPRALSPPGLPPPPSITSSGILPPVNQTDIKGPLVNPGSPPDIKKEKPDKPPTKPQRRSTNFATQNQIVGSKPRGGRKSTTPIPYSVQVQTSPNQSGSLPSLQREGTGTGMRIRAPRPRTPSQQSGQPPSPTSPQQPPTMIGKSRKDELEAREFIKLVFQEHKKVDKEKKKIEQQMEELAKEMAEIEAELADHFETQERFTTDFERDSFAERRARIAIECFSESMDQIFTFGSSPRKVPYMSSQFRDSLSRSSLSQTPTFSLEKLKDMDFVKNKRLNWRELERYLSEEEGEKVFEMEMVGFKKLPKWEQLRMRAEVGFLGIEEEQFEYLLWLEDEGREEEDQREGGVKEERNGCSPR